MSLRGESIDASSEALLLGDASIDGMPHPFHCSENDRPFQTIRLKQFAETYAFLLQKLTHGHTIKIK
jgi:hypothetical protein